MRIAPWQVWWIDFDPQVGREQAGLRPGIVVSSDVGCRLPTGLAVVVPCTSTNRDLPIHPAVDLEGRPSFAMCEQVKSVSHQRFRRLHEAVLTPDEVARIRAVLRYLIAV